MNNKFQRAAIAFAAASVLTLLSGCSLAPRYERPDAPVAQQFSGDIATTNNAANQRVATDIGWRDFYTDARLQALIATALENNRDLRSAALRIEEARALYNIQSADFLPTLNASAGMSRARNAAAASPLGVSTVTTSYQVGVSLSSFELDFFGRVRSLNNAALSQYLATSEARQAAQISLISEVAKAYLNERALAEQLALAQQSLAGRQQSYDLAKQRFEVGASSALDLRLNETLVASARVSVATLMRQRAQAENALTLLVGRPVNDLPAHQTLASQTIMHDIPAGLPSDLLERRPDIRAAELRLKASNANIGAARAAFFPRISLTASTGSASSSLSQLFDAGTRTWSFVPQMLLPIFDYGRNSNSLSLTEVRKDLAIADYEKNIQTAFREVADALAARSTINEQLDAQRIATEAQAERLRLADLRFKNGVASSLEVLDAQRELFNAEQSLVQARLLRLTNAVDLYRSLGGGNLERSSTTAQPKS